MTLPRWTTRLGHTHGLMCMGHYLDVSSKVLEASPSCLWKQCYVEWQPIGAYLGHVGSACSFSLPHSLVVYFLIYIFYFIYLLHFFISFFLFCFFFSFLFFNKVELTSFFFLFNQDGLVVRFSLSSPTLGLLCENQVYRSLRASGCLFDAALMLGIICTLFFLISNWNG